MQTFLIQMLVLSVGLVLALNLFGLTRGPDAYGWRTLQFMVGWILVPIVALALWFQYGAEDRLAELGITAWSGLVEVQGITAGHGEQRRSWTFTMDGQPRDLIAFYSEPEHRGDWQIAEQTGFMLILHRGEERLQILGTEQRPPTAFFIYRADESEQPMQLMER